MLLPYLFFLPICRPWIFQYSMYFFRSHFICSLSFFRSAPSIQCLILKLWNNGKAYIIISTYVNNDRKMKKWRRETKQRQRKECTKTLPIKALAVGRFHIYFIKVCFHIDNRLFNERQREGGEGEVQIEAHFKLTPGLIKQIYVLDGGFYFFF